ncbi:zinc ribbon domain-containing protein [Pectobacterium colocasium]|uniref:zinc ribbon domain-containing protein n=1 Tax=Pectobacterium TaxID=122277 RepID=UPI001CD1DA00|nr:MULTISPECIES: zinc ribbon domain-containing protein [Pectobacterium]UYA61410.1 YfgJ [Pectobacterium sp. F1-1]
MDAHCPDCHHMMLWQPDGSFRCEECQQRYLREAVCPECKHLLQELKACGAVDYFCQQHGMISKRRVVFSYLPAD